MELRHKRYAHNDEHDSVDLSIDLAFDDTSVEVKLNIELGMTVGLPAEWTDLLDWIGDHLESKMQGHLDRLSRLTGLEWKRMAAPKT